MSDSYFYINPMDAKGMGEIALIGFAAAVANAVFDATSQRIRTLPITPDKVMHIHSAVAIFTKVVVAEFLHRRIN